MSILSYTATFAGQVGIVPRLTRLVSNDNLATITALNYIPNNFDVLNGDFCFVNYGTGSTSAGMFTVSVTSSGVTLSQDFNEGSVIAGSNGDAGVFISYPPGLNSGYLQFAAVNNSGNFINTVSNASTGQATTWSFPDPGSATANVIISKSSGTQHITTGSLSVDVGNLTVGSLGHAGTVISIPFGAIPMGQLIFAAVNNGTGNFNTTISNASAVGQSQVVSIPDSGQAATNFILSDNAGTQTIATGSLALTAGNVTATAGNLQAGSSSHAGTVISFPAAATSGSLSLTAVNSSGNFAAVISNASLGQATTWSLQDPATATANILQTSTALVSGNIVTASGTVGKTVDGGIATNKVLTSGITNPDVGGNLIPFSVTCGFAALATGGAVTLITSSGSKQYRLWSLFFNKTGTNFSGGGGDRLGQVTDGTTAYSVVPATNMQTLLNAGWGISTPLPFPASVSISTLTAAGANLSFKYSGGTTDYTAGSVTISGLAERVV